MSGTSDPIYIQRHGAQKSTNPADVFPDWRHGKERWMFAAAHDDDIIIGAGLLIQFGIRENIPIRCVITTDGSQGYCDMEDRTRISEIRREECLQSMRSVGVDDTQWLHFPDGALEQYCGRRAKSELYQNSANEDKIALKGYIGLQNSFTWQIRDYVPTRIFVPGAQDYHPDHKLTHQQLTISIFHAQGAIWPELGEPITEIPSLYELAVYCPFASDPTMRVIGSAEHLQNKLNGVAAFQSQRQIASLVKAIEAGGPVEYLRETPFTFYHPSQYNHLFED